MKESASVNSSSAAPDQIFLINPLDCVSPFKISKVTLHLILPHHPYSAQGPQGQVQNFPHWQQSPWIDITGMSSWL